MSDWLDRAVTLHDHFDAHTTLRVAQPQPQYGTVQLNASFKGTLISVDVNAEDLLAALKAVLGTKAVAVIDEEAAGTGSTEAVVARFDTIAEADAYLEALPDQDKVLRGGYGIDAPDGAEAASLRPDQLVFDDRELEGPELWKNDPPPVEDLEEGPQ